MADGMEDLDRRSAPPDARVATPPVARPAMPPMSLTDTLKDEAMPAPIFNAVLEIQKAVKPIEKTGRNEFHKYDYATQSDILDMVRPLMNERGLLITQHPIGVSQDDGGNMVVRYKFRLQVVAGETVMSYDYPGVWLGVAQDRAKGQLGDKWFSKAATSAEKYFLLKLFKIPTTDEDTDADQMAGNNTPARPSRDDKPQRGSRGQSRREANVSPDVQEARDRFKKTLEIINGAAVGAALTAHRDEILAATKALAERSPEAVEKLVNRAKLRAHELGVNVDDWFAAPPAGDPPASPPPAEKPDAPAQPSAPVPQPGAATSQTPEPNKAIADFCMRVKADVKAAKSVDAVGKVTSGHRSALDRLREKDRAAYDDLMRFVDDRVADLSSFA